jgi:hypothetical protein
MSGALSCKNFQSFAIHISIHSTYIFGCFRKEDEVTEHHFSGGEETALEVYTVMYLTQLFIMSLGKEMFLET